MAQAPKLSTQGKYSGKYIVKDLFPRNLISTGDDLFSRVETSPNGIDGIFDTMDEALEAISDRKLETGRGLSSKEINRKYKKYIKAEGFNKWEETDKATKSRIKQAYANEKNPRETTSFFKKEGLSKRINVKTRELLEKKKPINPRTGLPYTLAEYTDLTSGQKQKLSLRMKGLKRKDVRYKPRQGYYPEKDGNRLINYMKIAAERQEKANIPVEERTYTTVFDKNNKFVGVNDVRKNQLYTHVDYNLSKSGALAGKVITQHPDYADMQEFFKAAKRFKYESPDKLLGSYFAKYERVPTYNEIFTFFTTNRDAPLQTFKNNSLTLQHQELISKEPTKNFQLLTQIKNTKAATIMNRLNRGEISSALANYELQKIGARQEGLGIAQKSVTPGKGLGVAKRETVKLFKDATKVNPNIVQDLTEKLGIKFINDAKANARAGGDICQLPMIKGKAGGGPALQCVDAVNDALEKDPKKLAQNINKSNAGGAFNKIKNSSTKFLTALKENPNLLKGRFGTLAAVGVGTIAAGAGAGALVKAFRNDDPSTYLTNDSQMEGMIIADVEQKGEEVDDNILLDNQFKLELAGAAGLTAPIAKSVYQKARASTPPLLESPLEFDKELKTLKRTIRQITHPKGKKAKRISQAGQEVLRNSRIRINEINEAMSAAKAGKEGSGIFKSALGLNKGVLGKGLWALGAPAIAVPSTIGYIAQDIRAGKDAGEIATNPLNYLGAAFMNPAVKALTKAGASRGLLGIASLGLAGTAAGAVALPAISIGAGLATLGTLGYQGYKLFTGGNERSAEDFFE